jgi:hypothetical protein
MYEYDQEDVAVVRVNVIDVELTTGAMAAAFGFKMAETITKVGAAERP